MRIFAFVEPGTTCERFFIPYISYPTKRSIQLLFGPQSPCGQSLPRVTSSSEFSNSCLGQHVVKGMGSDYTPGFQYHQKCVLTELVYGESKSVSYMNLDRCCIIFSSRSNLIEYRNKNNGHPDSSNGGYVTSVGYLMTRNSAFPSAPISHPVLNLLYK